MKEGWVIKRLDDACEVEYGTRVVRKRDGGTIYPVYGGGGATFFMDTFNREDCMIVARFAMSEQCTRFVKGKFFLNDSGLTVKPKDDSEILPDFLNLQMHFLNDYIYSLSRGTAQRNLDVPKFRNIKIAYPKSLPEQQRIVSILDQTFAAIDKAKANAEQNLQNAKELFESYLQGVFEKKGDGWETTTLGDVCTLHQGIAINAKTKHALVEKSNLPLLRIKDLKNNTEEQYIDPNNFPKNASVNEDDIIYTRTGSLGLVFRNRKGVLHNNSFKVVPNSKLDKDFLFIWLQNPIFKSKILDLALRAAQPDITHKIFKIQVIDIPPLKEQQTIVRQLDALRVETQKLEAVYQKKMDDLEELKKSILEKAFKGDLPVRQAGLT